MGERAPYNDSMYQITMDYARTETEGRPFDMVCDKVQEFDYEVSWCAELIELHAGDQERLAPLMDTHDYYLAYSVAFHEYIDSVLGGLAYRARHQLTPGAAQAVAAVHALEPARQTSTERLGSRA